MNRPFIINQYNSAPPVSIRYIVISIPKKGEDEEHELESIFEEDAACQEVRHALNKIAYLEDNIGRYIA